MQASADALVEEIASFAQDPLGYALFAFPWGEKGTALENKTGPRKWQRDVMEDIRKTLQADAAADVWTVIREAVASGHGIGKSALLAMLIKWAMDTREHTRGVVTANTEKQLLTKTWPELAKWHALSITAAWCKHTATAFYNLSHEKTWRIDAIAWSENNTEAFAGLHNEGKRIILIFDEASAIADKVWEVAEGALTDAKTEILWLVFGNATRATGRFRECFRKYKHRWRTRQIDSRTVEDVNVAELQKMVDDHGEDSDVVKVRIRGMFPNLSMRQFISEADVAGAYGKHLRPEQYNFAPRILTCDPAFEGDDELTIGFRQGLMFKVLEVIPKNDNDLVIANKLARYEDELRADAVFVDGGFGTGIISAGRTMGRDWTIVWFAGEAGDKGCANKRAEMYKLTRDWLREGGAIPEDPQLRDELQAPELLPRLDGKIQLESKKEMKRRGIPSPNRADCLVLSFAFPVAAKPRFANGDAYIPHNDNYGAAHRHGDVYNPFASE